MTDQQVRCRSRRAALLQLAAEEVRRAGLKGQMRDAITLAQRLEDLAADLLVGRASPGGVA